MTLSKKEERDATGPLVGQHLVMIGNSTNNIIAAKPRDIMAQINPMIINAIITDRNCAK